jgi:YidC/Oxa1 family membrane protein insertase
MSTLLQPLMWLEEVVLEGLHAIGLTWGLAIVGLTLIVRLSLLPLAVRQRDIRRRLAAHAPQLRALREENRDDVVAQQDALREYRKQHGLTSRGALSGAVLQLLVVISLALLLRSDSATGTFGDAGWFVIDDLSEPATGAALVLLLGGWVVLQLVSLRLAARISARRAAITLLAPIPLLFAVTQLPSGVLLYLFVSSSFAMAQRLALRAPARQPALAPA